MRWGVKNYFAFREEMFTAYDSRAYWHAYSLLGLLGLLWLAVFLV